MADAKKRYAGRRYDAERRKSQPWRALYNTAQWKALRLEQLHREPLCVMCKAIDKVEPAFVCDHVEPHRGDSEKFFQGPFQSLCVSHHDSLKQAQESRGYLPGCTPEGRPLDPTHPWNRPR